jgi:hypothetical protein
MAKKIYLFAAVMLMMAASLVFTGASSRAAMETPCEECYETCEYSFEGCMGSGANPNLCRNTLIQCNVACFNSVECNSR